MFKAQVSSIKKVCKTCACCEASLFTVSKLKGSHKSAQERLTVDEAFAGAEGGISEGGRDVTVEFGSVPVGTVAEKWIEVSNVSPVSDNSCIHVMQPASVFLHGFYLIKFSPT